MRYYLDHNATTPLSPSAKAAMIPWLSASGNPSSLHQEGRNTRAVIDLARDKIASLLEVKPGEIIFTSTGTESNNLAVLGIAHAHRQQGRHLITSAGEHPAVLESCRHLESEGFEVTYLPLLQNGKINPEDLRRTIRKETILVSIMSSNNETGVCQPMETIGSICQDHSILFHTDAIQSAGKEPLTIQKWKTHALSLAGHKFGGPSGAALLWLKSGISIASLHHGGSQENNRRPGSENVASIVGFAEALAEALPESVKQEKQLFLRIEKLWNSIADLPGIQRNGDPLDRLPNTLNCSFAGLNGENLLMALDLEGLAVSSGSACMAGTTQVSHVLLAMGVPEKTAGATLRLSIGKEIQESDIEEIARRIRKTILRLQQSA